MSEYDTSKTCSRCGSGGNRPYQRLFKCPECGYEINADFNASKNILSKLKRDMAHMPYLELNWHSS